MKAMELDKNYNFLEKRELYEDDLLESIDLITEAHSKHLISSKEATFLYKLALKKEIKKEAKAVIPTTKNSSEIHSLFMNMKSKQVRHA